MNPLNDESKAIDLGPEDGWNDPTAAFLSHHHDLMLAVLVLGRAAIGPFASACRHTP
jgi:hypothetical protein